MANEALYYGTGRRKNAIARVRFCPLFLGDGTPHII